MIGEFCTAQRERCLSYYDSISLQPRNQKWFNRVFSCPMRKITTIFSQTKHLNWKYCIPSSQNHEVLYLLVKDSTAINVKILLKQLAAGCLFKILNTTLECSSSLLLALQKDFCQFVCDFYINYENYWPDYTN